MDREGRERLENMGLEEGKGEQETETGTQREIDKGFESIGETGPSLRWA